MKLLSILTAVLLSASASFAADNHAKNFTIKDPKAVYASWYALNEACRGGSSSDNNTWKACGRREFITEILVENGHCTGNQEQPGVAWQKCDPDS